MLSDICEKMKYVLLPVMSAYGLLHAYTWKKTHVIRACAWMIFFSQRKRECMRIRGACSHQFYTIPVVYACSCVPVYDIYSGIASKCMCMSPSAHRTHVHGTYVRMPCIICKHSCVVPQTLPMYAHMHVCIHTKSIQASAHTYEHTPYPIKHVQT
jgi:hypothetical protein